MLVNDAKAIARDWINQSSANIPGFQGAFFHGSVNWLPDDVELPSTSDLDVMIILADEHNAAKPGKLVYRDVLLEISFISNDELRSPEQILGRSELAGSLAAASVIADPTGHLTGLQAAVSRDYAKRRWVRARYEQAREKVRRNLAAIDPAAPFPDQITAWLFGAGVTTHILLVAGLENPTVRKRYSAVRALLAEYGRLDFYEPLLALLGCGQMTRDRVERRLASLEGAFDAAAAVIRSPFFFAADISPHGQSVAIEGSRELIEQGEHREAVFWIVATYARCLTVLHHDAPPEMRARHEPGFRALLADLGIVSPADLLARSGEVEAFLPRVREVAEQVMSANQRIES